MTPAHEERAEAPRAKTISGADGIARALGLYTLLPTDSAARRVAHALSLDPDLLAEVVVAMGKSNPLEISPHDFAETAHIVIVRRRRP